MDPSQSSLSADQSRPTSTRDRVVLFLLFLTSDACRRSLARRIPEDRIIFELCRVWFDEIYVPGPRYLDGLKGDLTAERVAEFASHFTDEEFESLERFHAFFELRMDMQPEKVLRDRSFPDSDLWQNVVRDARYIVEDLEPNAEKRRAMIEWFADSTVDADSPVLSRGSLFLGN